MKLHTKLGIFVSGMLTCALMLGCITMAFAVTGGKVTFGTVGVEINRKTAIEKGSELTTDAGQPIPSSITYTDETGGGTTYLPVAAISRMLELPVAWDAETSTVQLGAGGSKDFTVTVDPEPGEGTEMLNYPGAQAGRYTEVEPIVPEHNDGSQNCHLKMSFTVPIGFSDVIYPSADKNMISVTVTNRSNYPLQFGVAAVDQFTRTKLPASLVPVGETVTRTFSVEEYEGYFGSDGLALSLRCQREYQISNPGHPGELMADIIAVEL